MATALTDLSNALAALVDETSRSLVAIDARRRFPASGIVWSSDGLIVTNHHVIHRETDIRVHLPDGTVAPAELLGRDQQTDVAVLRVEASGLEAPRWGSEGLRVGEIVVAVGNPGTGARAAMGMVSVAGGRWRTRSGGDIDAYIETDLPIFAGFSGSPLVGAGGEMIGINTSALVRGASIAIPHATVARSVSTLLEHGRIPQGYLGISSYAVVIPESGSDVESRRGLLVVSIDPESPAERVGMILGDIVTSVAGRPTTGADSIRAILGSETIGREIEVNVLRGGEPMTLRVTVTARG